MINEIYCGDVMELMGKLKNESIDCLITSPPYWQLRDYGYPEQWGLEPTYQEYLEHLWSWMDEVKRVLKKTGTVWVNLGDTYGTFRGKSGSGADSFERKKTGGGHHDTVKQVIDRPNKNVFEKCLLLIPHRFAIGCIDRGWIIRNDIIWAKPNCMPEPVTDRFSKKHEYFFFMTKSQKYYFDLEPHNFKQNANGKNPGSVSDFWQITTKGSSDKHYASFNTKLIEKPIIAGCPKEGIILDPFCGTGTTLARGLELGRKVIGFDGKEEYCRIASNNICNYLYMIH